MKHAMYDVRIQKSEISKNLSSIKKIVSTVKHANFNEDLPEGYKLIQEVETRFGTTFDTVKRFIKSVSNLKSVLKTKSGDAAEKINN